MTKPILKISNLSFSYDKKQKIIENFSAEFNCGSRVCIEAPSGVGKTTLLRLICGIEKCDEGKIEFLLSKPKIALVSQQNDLLPWYSAKKNVSLVSDEKTALKFFSAMKLEGHENKLLSELSGGMIKRVAIAKALAHDADIYLFDEAFSGLDKKLAEEIMLYLSEKLKDKLIIFTTHNEFEKETFSTEIIRL